MSEKCSVSRLWYNGHMSGPCRSTATVIFRPVVGRAHQILCVGCAGGVHASLRAQGLSRAEADKHFVYLDGAAVDSIADTALQLERDAFKQTALPGCEDVLAPSTRDEAQLGLWGG